MERTQDVDLVEFERLRQEIDNRTNLLHQVIALELTVLGVGISVFAQFPDVVVALAAVSSFLWLLWLDHVSQVYKIAAYIGLRLAPRLRLRHEQGEALGWERFLRELDLGGQSAKHALYRSSSYRVDVSVMKTRSVVNYISILFGGVPPLLLTAYVLSGKVLLNPLESRPGLFRLAALFLALGMWLFSLRRSWIFRKALSTVDQALLFARDEDGDDAQLAEDVAEALTVDAPVGHADT